MPSVLNEPVSISESFNAFNITSWAVDQENFELHIVYDRGTQAGGVFTPTVRNKAYTAQASEFMSAIASANAHAAAMEDPDVYQAIKLALYEVLHAATGLTGVVE